MLTSLVFQGYEADHPNIELLRLRNYTIGRKLKDEEVLSSKATDTIVDLMGTMTPFVRPNFSLPHSEHVFHSRTKLLACEAKFSSLHSNPSHHTIAIR